MHQLHYLLMLHHLGSLLQNNANNWEPIDFASMFMTKVKHRYTQIENKALAAIWACEKFTYFILGAKFTIETDHKPLVLLLSTTHLHNLPPRVLCF